MISISHWGMFEVKTPHFIVPAGFRLSDEAIALNELLRPEGWVEIVRD